MGCVLPSSYIKKGASPLEEKMSRNPSWLHLLILPALLLCNVGAQADQGGRLPATGGVTEVEGAAGGGLTPWALIAGYDTRDQVGGNAFVTRVTTQGFRLTSAGAAVGLFDRVELSYARQRFNLGDTVPGQNIEMDTFGAKMKVCGDTVFNQDRPWPQIAVGIMAKHNRDFDGVPKALGGRHASDIEPYMAATKVWLDGIAGRTVLLDGTLRLTRANQLGLLGFGGDKDDSRKLRFEGSAAVFLTDRIILGAEWRQKPDNLSVFKEDAFADAFLAWVPNRRVAITLAQTELGNIANKDHQRGPYLSAKFDF